MHSQQLLYRYSEQRMYHLVTYITDKAQGIIK